MTTTVATPAPMTLLEHIVTSVLACPLCRGSLVLHDAKIECTSCGARYAMVDGIPVLLRPGSLAQDEERQIRDSTASTLLDRNDDDIIKTIGRHHCVSVMRERAKSFRARFDADENILDIGIGFGWHWIGVGEGAAIIGVDMSLDSLRVARKLLRSEDRVVLICADAAALPLRDASIAGVWSVQVLQHLPDAVMRELQHSLDRVLGRKFALEIYNVNPARIEQIIFRMFGLNYERHGRVGDVDLTLLDGPGLLEQWRAFRSADATMSYGFSELFFHPGLRIRPSPYPERLEKFVSRSFPRVSAKLGRQIHLRMESRG